MRCTGQRPHIAGLSRGLTFLVNLRSGRPANGHRARSPTEGTAVSWRLLPDATVVRDACSSQHPPGRFGDRQTDDPGTVPAATERPDLDDHTRERTRTPGRTYRISHVGTTPSVTKRDRDSRHQAVRGAATAQVTVTADQPRLAALRWGKWPGSGLAICDVHRLAVMMPGRRWARRRARCGRLGQGRRAPRRQVRRSRLLGLA